MNSKVIVNMGIISSLFGFNLAVAAPQNGAVVAGTASIAQNGPQTVINQSTSSAIINWKGFDTAANESVKFNQPGSSSVILNRVTSGQPTNFAGSLTANGRVFIVNPAGMVFANTSTVNVAGLLATTMDINNDDFMKGDYKFFTVSGANPNAWVVNNGNITTSETYGFVSLLAPNVSNGKTGVIQAYLGKVILGSGKKYVLDFNNDGLINFDVSDLASNGHVINAGSITANGGTVVMTAVGVSGVLDNEIEMSGVIEADNARIWRDGTIVLAAGEGGGIKVSGKADGTRIIISAGKNLSISGSLSHPNGWSWDQKGIYLAARNGTITEEKTGSITTPVLLTRSMWGTSLGSTLNKVDIFSAYNIKGGDVYLNDDVNEVWVVDTHQHGGNLDIYNTGYIGWSRNVGVVGDATFSENGGKHIYFFPKKTSK